MFGAPFAAFIILASQLDVPNEGLVSASTANIQSSRDDGEGWLSNERGSEEGVKLPSRRQRGSCNIEVAYIPR